MRRAVLALAAPLVAGAAAPPAPTAPTAPTVWTATLTARGSDALDALLGAIPLFAREGIAVAVTWGTPGVMRPGPITRATLRATSRDRAALDRASAAAGGFADKRLRPAPLVTPLPGPAPLRPTPRPR